MKRHFGKTFVLVIFLFLNARCSILTPAIWEFLSENHENLNDKAILKEYDFVIVGAGSAGSVLANRLTENPRWKILLLESGKEENYLTDIPLFAPAFYFTDYVHSYKSEPGSRKGKDGFCLSMKDTRCNLYTGNAVGGSSVVNYVVYARGSPLIYDDWEALGNPGWSYENVLPYFKKSENCRIADLDPRYHGYEGYLEIVNVPYATPLRECFLNASAELGYDLIDYNAKTIGFSKIQSNLRNGHRMSASKAFLRPIKDRTNFYLSKSSRATKIVIDRESKVAIGVEFVKKGKSYFVRANKEVILSAGALGSPKLLMLSGIGPKDDLKSLGIQPIVDLPVGSNLQDHMILAMLNFLINETVNIDIPKFNDVAEYIIKGTGPLTTPSGTEAIAFISSEDSSSTGKPDIELIFYHGSFVGSQAKILRGISGLSDEVYNSIFSKYEGSSAFSISTILLNPKSRGRMSLKSANPFQEPIIDLNYFDQKDDVKTMIRGIKKTLQIASSKAFERYNATLVPLHRLPACNHTVYLSDAFWGCLIRQMSTSSFHYSGTCTMSPRNKSGVVDHRLQVYGIKSLRVVDNSIIPIIITGHLAAAAYMIAEKAADMIKEDWKFPTN
ncbi:glucose dehydrogenase [FAD, quinone]-like [Vespula pensylvanica]|uniref:glucose dehydrogenase [FAD, quinone]-like n=1 Tax=Vespula pensylvanica TaxID=30213 RepID=UPI001CBA51AE|nr:glucose dehydrogenase [FAD, quinone]-like [Vespula pensylvanica]